MNDLEDIKQRVKTHYGAGQMPFTPTFEEYRSARSKMELDIWRLINHVEGLSDQVEHWKTLATSEAV